MSCVVEKLTEQQQAMFQPYTDKWLGIGLQAGKPLPSQERLLQLFTAIYKEGNITAPTEIHVTAGPTELIRTAVSQYGLTRSEALGAILYGSQDAGWLSFYAFFLGETPQVKGPERLIPLMELAKAGIGWCIPLERTVLVSPVPQFIHMKQSLTERNVAVLHSLTGPAIRYEDGTEVWASNGVVFRDSMISFLRDPIDQLSSQSVIGIANAEQRMEVIKRIGLHKFIDALNPQIIDTGSEHGYRLLGIQFPGDTTRKYLQMQNPSVPETHLEGVHPDCITVEQALQWRNFGEVSGKWVAPLKLT